MNKTNLQVIFKKYIDNFERINDDKNDENYKWEIAEHFQNFDLDTRIKNVYKDYSNTIISNDLF